MAIVAVALSVAAIAPEVKAQSSVAAPAVVADSSDGGGPGGGTFFLLEAVDGVDVAETALTASFRASAGRGAYMIVKGAERTLPAGRVALRIRGIHTHVAPIDSIFRAIFRGGNPEVSGAVTVELSPGQRYIVNGALDGFKREVWIEDDRGTEVSGSRVAAAADPDLIRKMEGSAFVATNLRYDGDWINEASVPGLPFVPAGARLKVLDYGANRVSVLIDGRKMRLGVDWTRSLETIQQFVSRVTTKEDPRPAIAGFPDRVRNAVKAGKVFPGMTRDQVLIALGRPRIDFTPRLTDREWKYEVHDQGELFLVFDDSGLLKEIDGARKARKLVLYEVE